MRRLGARRDALLTLLGLSPSSAAAEIVDEALVRLSIGRLDDDEERRTAAHAPQLMLERAESRGCLAGAARGSPTGARASGHTPSEPNMKSRLRSRTSVGRRPAASTKPPTTRRNIRARRSVAQAARRTGGKDQRAEDRSDAADGRKAPKEPRESYRNSLCLPRKRVRAALRCPRPRNARRRPLTSYLRSASHPRPL